MAKIKKTTKEDVVTEEEIDPDFCVQKAAEALVGTEVSVASSSQAYVLTPNGNYAPANTEVARVWLEMARFLRDD